jgi:acyl-CoA ligase (AMP-forming) (exosortase A-associated)
MTLDDLLFRAAALYPGKPALIFQKESVLYSALAADVRRFAHAARKAGIGAGERIGIFLEKRPEAAVAIMGAAAADAVFVPINPALRPAQVAHLVKDCGIKLLVTSRGRITELEEALASCPSLQRIVFVEDEAAPLSSARTPCQSLRRFLETGYDEPASWSRGADTDMVGILYTSGSTGEPKGVMLSHRNFVARAKCVSEYLDLSPDDRILHLPHYSFGFGLDQLFNGFYAGATGVLHNYVTPQALMKVMLEERITGLAGVPTALVALTALDWPLEIREHLRYIAAAGGRMPESATRSLRCLAPEARIFLMYGQTETLRSTFLPPSEVDYHPNSMGRPISVAKIHVVRADGTLCGPNEPGELVQTGDTVALGYWNDPERTAQIFRPAPAETAPGSQPQIGVWSGDMVTYDEGGRLYYIGRQDDLIKTSGYRVSPTEIEDVLYASGLVETAAVVGVKHSDLGQVVVAFVTTRGNESLDRDGLLAHCRRDLPGYMLPYQFVHRDTLPLNANSKIDRRRLVSEYGEQLHDTVLERPRATLDVPGPEKTDRMSRALEFLGMRRRTSSSVAEIFASAFNLKSIDDQKSFSSLGGDSLSYVDVSTALEDHIGHVPENWENMSIAELEQIPRSSSRNITVSADVLVRTAAIVGVVAFHNRYSNLAGGPNLLFALSGFSFARFAWSSDPSNVRRSIIGTMLRIVGPTMLLLLVLFLGDGIIHWSTIFFDDNLLGTVAPEWSGEGTWFVQVLFQILLFMGILVSIPGIARFGDKHRYAFGIILTVGGFLLHYTIANAVHARILSSDHLPQYYLWQFALGWLLFSSKGHIQRGVTMLILLACMGALFTIRGKTGEYLLDFHGPYWLLIGSALLMWMPSVPLPRLVAAPVVTIAKAAIFIYLFHWPFDVAASKWFHIHGEPLVHGGPFGIIVGLAGGVIVWILYEWLTSAIRSIRGTAPQPVRAFE